MSDDDTQTFGSSKAAARAEIDRLVATYHGDVNLALASILTDAQKDLERGLLDDARRQMNRVKMALHCAEIQLWRVAR